MPTAMATPPGQTSARGGQAQQVMNRPFVVGSRYADDYQYDKTATMTTTPVKLDTYELDTDGFTAGLYILAENTGSGNATVTAAFKEDGPTNALSIIQLSDTNNKPVVGPFDGHDLATAVKYGGYHFVDDTKQSNVYSVTTGTASTQGSFTFVLYLPFEIVHRDALGATLNKSASAVWKLDMTVNTTTNVFSSAPATSNSLRIRVTQFGWMDSDGQDIKGNPTSVNPPALNSLQFWDRQSNTVTAGNIAEKLNTFSGGVRNLIFILRDSSATRSGNEADWPDPFTLQVDKYILTNRLRTMWRHLIAEAFGYTAAVETAGGRDYGTYPLWFNGDFGLKPGAENRFHYLWVSSATSITMKGSVGGSGAHTISTLVNYVNPANGDPRALTGGR